MRPCLSERLHWVPPTTAQFAHRHLRGDATPVAVVIEAGHGVVIAGIRKAVDEDSSGTTNSA